MKARTKRILVYVAVVGFALYSVWSVQGSSNNLRDGLIESCEVNGNPLRAAVRQFGAALVEQTRSDMQQSAAFEKSGAYAEFFPGIPADKLHHLLLKDRREALKEIKGIKAASAGIPGVNCVEQYR